MMAWQEPKINWKGEDSFNILDYNRIKNNLEYVWEQACVLWGAFRMEDMGEDMVSYEGIWNIEYFNAFEMNVDTISEKVGVKKGMRQTFYSNGVFIRYDELNRIEESIWTIKRMIDEKKEGMVKLPFRLGSPKGLHV